MNELIICPSCHIQFGLSNSAMGLHPRYCPYCHATLHSTDSSTGTSEDHQADSSISSTFPSVSFLPEHLPSADQVQFSIGPYQILESIGKGGMGEVFLAYDTICGRRLALKQIRPDLMQHKQLHNRFLKEARITSQLTHPAIIPIYAIHSAPDLTYYTMPYVEGETLKQVLRNARKLEKIGRKIPHVTESIPALIRIFLSICQAVAYAHSKQILHRDLKPENIIVGQYGQIVILDWGLAKLLKTEPESQAQRAEEVSEIAPHPLHHLTHVGKVVGTITYMAPERAVGMPANFQTDVYSLGVILYQLLTLKQPFHRESLKSFKKNMDREVLIDPTEAAPYRDVPRSLSRVVMKCLASNPEQRYVTVDALVHDIENYIEGRSEWFQIAELKIENKNDWEFQEHVLIAEHMALTRDTEASDWVNLMISKESFEDNIKLKAKVKIGEQGHGIGFLLSIPEVAERVHLNDGYCLWLGTDNNRVTKLLRSTVEVMHAPDVFLQRNQWVSVCIEKIDQSIHVYLDDALQFSYISHLPLVGTHVGLILRDADFSLSDLNIFIRSQNVTVNCLAVPDAFLAHNDYATALSEYRRIGYSFPGRAEGREAMFRAGVTLLEQATNTQDEDKKQFYYDQAQEEFHKLYNTPGAPLEYLGKALVYQAIGDFEEEAKCFELAYRRYPSHPLLPVLQEQIVYRMHESSRQNRQATFNFILLALRYLPSVISTSHTKKILSSLEKHWEPLFFIEADPSIETSNLLKRFIFSIQLSFWLARPYTLSEIITELLKQEILHPITISNALFCLIELGSYLLAQTKLNEVIEQYGKRKLLGFEPFQEFLQLALFAHTSSLEDAIKKFIKLPFAANRNNERVLLYLMETALDEDKSNLVHTIYAYASSLSLSSTAKLYVDAYEVWAFLLQNNTQAASHVLNQYPLEFLGQETTILHFLYGCLLYATEGKEIGDIHFTGVFEVPYPRTWALFSYYLKGKIADESTWTQRSFLWEKRQLYRQLALFYRCLGNLKIAHGYQERANQASVEAQI